jgi:hypothetical protein
MDLADNLEPLLLDLVEWVAETPRPYSDVLAARQTSCTRLTVFGDVIDLGLLDRYHDTTGKTPIGASDAGRTYLKEKGRTAH